PVQTVRWEIRPLNVANTGDGPYMSLPAASGDKYELFRTFIDVTGLRTQQTELVAEYPVDLKFAFSSDLSLAGLANRTLTVYGLSADAQNPPPSPPTHTHPAIPTRPSLP